MGKTTIKDWEEWKLCKCRRSLRVYWYTTRFKFSLHFKQLNLEMMNAAADLCSNKRPRASTETGGWIYMYMVEVLTDC